MQELKDGSVAQITVQLNKKKKRRRRSIKEKKMKKDAYAFARFPLSSVRTAHQKKKKRVLFFFVVV